MFKHEVIEPEFANEVKDADESDVDSAEVRVRTQGSCVVLEIASALNGVSVAAPVVLSAAASRALAAELMKCADAAEPIDDQG
jgi:hypothetical protein